MAIFAQELYINTHGTYISILQMVFYDDTTTIGFVKPSEMYVMRRDIMQARVVDMYSKLDSQDRGEVTDLFKSLSAFPMCEVLANTNDDGAPFKNCDIAMAGIASGTIGTFIQSYLKMCDSIFNSWKIGETLETRYKMISDPRFNSFIAFATTNLFGLADGQFYHYLVPTYTLLKKRLLALESVIKLTNQLTVSAVFIIIVLIY